MDIAAHLHPNLLAHLTVVAGAQHRILGSETWESLVLRIRTEPIDLAVLDPMANGKDRSDAILAVLEEFPSVPVVLYTQLSPEMLQATVALARAGVRHVVLFRFDDSHQRFLELLESQPGSAMVQMLLRELATPLLVLGAGLKHGIERMFGAPGHFGVVPDLARSAKVSKRTIYRSFKTAGLASPRKFLHAARLLRAYAYMLEPGNTLEIAGNKLGYEPISFRRIVRQFFNTTPNSIKRSVAPEEFVQTLAKALYPGLGKNPPD
jgi:AraC-like DNA-binding protein